MRNGPWFLEMQPSEPDEETDLPHGWAGDGAIASVHTQQLATKLRASGVPVINVSGTRLYGVDFPRVTTDAEAVMRMAVTHLRDRAVKNIAFCGEPHRRFIDFWTDVYRAVMHDEEMEAVVYKPSAGIGSRAGLEAQQEDRRRWIESLPKPTAIIGWATSICRRLAMACAMSGIRVPEEIAIISLETEDLLGMAVHPPLSGVDVPVERIGYEAASQLDRLLHGEALGARELHLPPLGVTTRQSTDVVACDDPGIRQALCFIRDHAHEGIDVRTVLKAVPMARRTLERRLQSLLGRSPAEEIRRVKIEKVRVLLGSTSMSIPDIAEACGFNYAEHMIPVFKKYHGCTPSSYRRQRMTTARDLA